MDNKGFTLRKRIKSFKFALNGIWLLLREGGNIWVHGMVAVCVIIAGALFGLSAMEWAAIAILCGCVFAAEAFNTAIERLCDVVSPEYSEAIKRVKDISAGAVLIMAIAAVVVGLIIFVPKLLLHI